MGIWWQDGLPSIHSLLLPIVLTASACSDVRTTPDLPPPDLYGHLGSIDLSARSPLRAGVPQRGDAPPRADTYLGRPDSAATFDRGDFTGSVASNGSAANAVDATQGGYQVNFENAPIQSVVKAVLGDTLGIGYDIDPRVQGNITLSFARPLDQKQVLFALENALRMSNIALVKGPGGYRVIPTGEALGETALSGRGVEPGFGLSVFPLRFVNAATMMKLLDGFATKPGAIRIDNTRNLLLIAGTGQERQEALRTAETFDADFMRGQSVGIYPLRRATPKVMIAELENIMVPAGEAAEQSLIRFQPIDRLNAILVVTRQPALLSKASSWISRLDRTDSADAGIKVYRVRYGEAKHIAAVLTDLFRGGPGSADTSSQAAPGYETQTSRNDPVSSLSTLGGSGASVAGPSAGVLGVGAARPDSANAAFGTLSGSSFAASRQANATAAPGPGASDSGPSQNGTSAVRVTADPVTNSLLITANRQDYQAIERTLLEIDRPPLQVAIEATIAEVTLNNNLNYGVQYFLKSQDLGLGRNNGSAGLSTNSVLNGMISKVLPGANLLLGPDADPRIVLDALRAYTDVKVISSPSLVVLDNQVATLQVGDSVPVATSSATLVSAATSSTPVASVGFPVANTIDYRNTGVILRVLPRVNYNGNVSLDVEQEISSIVPSVTADTLTPTVSERKIKSSIAVASEQTVLLAGLISDTQNNTRTGLPFVERIQGIGDFFSSNSRAHARTELIIFIRPKIIRDGNDASDVAEALRSRILMSNGAPGNIGRTLIRKF